MKIYKDEKGLNNSTSLNNYGKSMLDRMADIPQETKEALAQDGFNILTSGLSPNRLSEFKNRKQTERSLPAEIKLTALKTTHQHYTVR